MWLNYRGSQLEMSEKEIEVARAKCIPRKHKSGIANPIKKEIDGPSITASNSQHGSKRVDIEQQWVSWSRKRDWPDTQSLHFWQLLKLIKQRERKKNQAVNPLVFIQMRKEKKVIVKWEEKLISLFGVCKWGSWIILH